MFQDSSTMPTNYETFISKLLKSGKVWGIRHSNGTWATTQSKEHEDTLVYMVWSDKAYAKSHCKGEWSDYAPSQIDLDSFINSWLTDIHESGQLVSPNWAPHLCEIEIEPLALAHQLSKTDAITKIIKIVIFFILPITAFILGMNYVINTNQADSLRKTIPLFFEIEKTLITRMDTGFLDGMGTGVFLLTNNTIEIIQSEGITSFLTENKPRGTFDKSSEYLGWKETPLPEAWTAEGRFPYGFYGHELRYKIAKAAQSEGSFYTVNQEKGVLMLIPDLNMILHSFDTDISVKEFYKDNN